MSLDFDFSEITNWETVCKNPDGTLSGRTECIIWLMMFTGTSKIVDPVETYLRFRFYETLFRPICTNGEHITWDEVKAHVGLRTNVTPESKAVWRKRMFENFERENRP